MFIAHLPGLLHSSIGPWCLIDHSTPTMLRASRNSPRCQSRARRWSRNVGWPREAIAIRVKGWFPVEGYLAGKVARLGQQDARHGWMLHDVAGVFQVTVDHGYRLLGVGDGGVNLVTEATGNDGELRLDRAQIDPGFGVARSLGPEADVLSLEGLNHLVEETEGAQPVAAALVGRLLALRAIRDQVHGRGRRQAPFLEAAISNCAD